MILSHFISATWTSCTYFIALGLVFGLDTLGSQAYGAGTDPLSHVSHFLQEIMNLLEYCFKMFSFLSLLLQFQLESCGHSQKVTVVNWKIAASMYYPSRPHVISPTRPNYCWKGIIDQDSNTRNNSFIQAGVFSLVLLPGLLPYLYFSVRINHDVHFSHCFSVFNGI